MYVYILYICTKIYLQIIIIIIIKLIRFLIFIILNVLLTFTQVA